MFKNRRLVVNGIFESIPPPPAPATFSLLLSQFLPIFITSLPSKFDGARQISFSSLQLVFTSAFSFLSLQLFFALPLLKTLVGLRATALHEISERTRAEKVVNLS